MKRAFDQFEENIARAQHMRGLYAALRPNVAPALELSDLLRAEVVLSVSAFDTFVHEVVRIGMLDIFEGRRTATDAYQRFQVSLDSATTGFTSKSSAWLDAEIRNRHGYLAFQMPDKVADAIRYVIKISIWDAVAKTLSRPTVDVKQELRLIVERRNKIAHEADLDPSSPGSRWPIDEAMCQKATEFIVSLVKAILAEL